MYFTVCSDAENWEGTRSGQQQWKSMILSECFIISLMNIVFNWLGNLQNPLCGTLCNVKHKTLVIANVLYIFIIFTIYFSYKYPFLTRNITWFAVHWFFFYSGCNSCLSQATAKLIHHINYTYYLKICHKWYADLCKKVNFSLYANEFWFFFF